jgi:hypothetical protein
MTRTAWFHCFAGTAGDMTLGALVDAGADPDRVAAAIAGLGIDGWALTFEAVQRHGISATRAVVAVHDHAGQDHAGHHPHRPFAEIRRLLTSADLPSRVHERALAVFTALAEVEGALHGARPEDVELHEVGSLDAIVDVVGACAALDDLGVERVVCSPIAVGTGTIRAAHGVLPNPAPATTALLARAGAPARGLDDPLELATPTGVALMTVLADSFGSMPPMAVRSTGFGAGAADPDARPNVVQVVVGEVTDPTGASPDAAGQPVRLLEVNVDDVTGEVLAHTVAALLAAGAHDAWATPIVMKKGRPAHTVHALCDPALTATLAAVLVAETGSLGVRGAVIERWPQSRGETTVVVEGYQIRVKLTAGRAKVEHDDAAIAAAALGWPLRAVLLAAEAQASPSA